MTRKGGLEVRLFWQRSMIRKDRHYAWYFLIVNRTDKIDEVRMRLQSELYPSRIIEIAGDHIPESGLNYEFLCMHSASPDIDWGHAYRLDKYRVNNLKLADIALMKERGRDITQELADIYRERV